jgi:hypothetical protein
MEAVSDAARRIDYYLAALGKTAPPIDLSDEELQAAVDSFARAMARLKTERDSLAATYGDAFRVGRDESSWPLGGGGDYGTTTLRNIGYGRQRVTTRLGRARPDLHAGGGAGVSRCGVGPTYHWAERPAELTALPRPGPEAVPVP